MSKIAVVIRQKCAKERPLAEKGDAKAAKRLEAAGREAADMIPHGMSEEDLQKIQLFIIANCTPQKKQQ